jgi:hypothetical protein
VWVLKSNLSGDIGLGMIVMDYIFSYGKQLDPGNNTIHHLLADNQE